MATSLLPSGYPPCSRSPIHTASLFLSEHPRHIPTHRALVLLICTGPPLIHDSFHSSGSLINVIQSVRCSWIINTSCPFFCPAPLLLPPWTGYVSLCGPILILCSVYLFAACVSLGKHQFCVDGHLLDSLSSPGLKQCLLE